MVRCSTEQSRSSWSYLVQCQVRSVPCWEQDVTVRTVTRHLATRCRSDVIPRLKWDAVYPCGEPRIVSFVVVVEHTGISLP